MIKTQEIINSVTNTQKHCLLNVTRQIGTTTALFHYMLSEYTKSGKNIVYCTHNWLGRQYVIEEIIKSLVDIINHMIDNAEYRFVINRREQSIYIPKHKDKKIFLLDGNIRVERALSGKEWVKNIGLIILDNADFYEYTDLLAKITEMSDGVRVIAASTPSVFNGKWTPFKKTYITQPENWVIEDIKGEYDNSFKSCLTGERYDSELENYDSFFKPMRLIYKNIGDKLFETKQ